MGLYVIDSKEYTNSKSSLTKEKLINLNECVNDNNNDLLVSWDFLSGSVIKSPPAVKKWQETWVQWHGSPFQYSCLENTMDRGAWRAIVHGVAKSQI